MKLRERKYPGTLVETESSREKEHREIARKAAAEGIVLLENNGVLPLQPGAKIALYGFGARYTIKGGTGSGSVNNRSNVSIDEGLRNMGFTVTTDDWLDDYDRRYNAAREAWVDSIYRIAGDGFDFDALYTAHSGNPMSAPVGKAITPEEKTDTDTAVYVISRVSGEGTDRYTKKGDYYLSDAEYSELKAIASVYEKIIVVLNTGGIIDLSFTDELKTDALVYMSQAGMEGGNALADILSGNVNPSGKLTDTWAYAYEDYPGSRDFSHNNGNLFEEKYTEGVFVGYRYFDTFGVKPRYSFGYGLSYTNFTLSTESVALDGHRVIVRVKVANTGAVSGREVVQAYVSCPSGHMKKEKKRLVSFAKTSLLAPGEEETETLEFDLSLLESYWAGKASYYMDEGAYYLFIGTSVSETEMAACLTLDDTVFVRKLTNICPLLSSLTEIEPSDELISAWEAECAESRRVKAIQVISIDNAIQNCVCREHVLQNDKMQSHVVPDDTAQSHVVQNDVTRDCALKNDTTQEHNHIVHKSRTADEEETKKDAIRNAAGRLVKELTLEQKATLVCGRVKDGEAEVIGNASVTVPGAAGETTRILEDSHNIGSIILADGPAGLRLQKHYEENPEDGSIYTLNQIESLENRIFQKEFLHEGSISHYQYCSAIPVGTLLGQTFDVELLQEVGEMIGREMEEFGVTLWLAPGMNIHRNPLCGRNFEYYSEDPLVSGRMAAAITLGVQKLPGVGTTIKHFACNNQEDNRWGVDSIVSERALREIYLKGFEIAVKTSQPMAIMTSYNKVNGVHAANNYDLCTTAARDEWGFEGLIMTDWTTTNNGRGSSAAKCISAGNDLVMPGRPSDIQEIIDAVHGEKHLSLDEQDLDACVARILRIILASNVYEGAESYL